MLPKPMIIIAINHFVIVVNFRNLLDKDLKEIFQFCKALYSRVEFLPAFKFTGKI